MGSNGKHHLDQNILFQVNKNIIYFKGPFMYHPKQLWGKGMLAFLSSS